ncbi:MAG: helix-turn-helix domain-containing protein [Streptosporangiales bacterium]|nr:helix-turn-helix domain-containing protein [Streptosporangiales bacterium]
MTAQVSKVLSVKHAAEALDVSRTSVYDLIARGELTATRVGGRIRVPVNEVEALIKKNKIPRRPRPSRGAA